MGSRQLGFGDYEQSTAKKRTRRERFLDEMENVVPWKAVIDLIEPHYPKTSSNSGHKSYPLSSILYIHLVQQWYDLSDRIPDETTILTFRHLLEMHDLGQQIFEVVKAHLKANGVGPPDGWFTGVQLSCDWGHMSPP